jgi:hypothetical protein
MKVQVSHTNEKTSEIIVLYILIIEAFCEETERHSNLNGNILKVIKAVLQTVLKIHCVLYFPALKCADRPMSPYGGLNFV